MAINDVVSDIQVLSQNGTLDIRPPVDEEWIVINIFASGPIEIQWIDQSNAFLWKFLDFGIEPFIQNNVTNARWLRLKALETGSTNVGYTGVKCK